MPITLDETPKIPHHIHKLIGRGNQVLHEYIYCEKCWEDHGRILYTEDVMIAARNGQKAEHIIIETSGYIICDECNPIEI